jgi:hypothetical protein
MHVVLVMVTMICATALKVAPKRFFRPKCGQRIDSGDFTPPIVGTEIYVGSFVSLIPIAWATVEFTSRIRTQQQCAVCNGHTIYLPAC